MTMAFLISAKTAMEMTYTISVITRGAKLVFGEFGAVLRIIGTLPNEKNAAGIAAWKEMMMMTLSQEEKEGTPTATALI